MSFVVTNDKIFQEFPTLEKAVKFYEHCPEFGLRVVERDVFGNLTTVDDEKVENAKERVRGEERFDSDLSPEDQQKLKERAAQPQPVQPGTPAQPVKQPVKQVSQEQDVSPIVRYVKWGLIVMFGFIVFYLFIMLVLPIIMDFMRTWRSI